MMMVREMSKLLWKKWNNFFWNWLVFFCWLSLQGEPALVLNSSYATWAGAFFRFFECESKILLRSSAVIQTPISDGCSTMKQPFGQTNSRPLAFSRQSGCLRQYSGALRLAKLSGSATDVSPPLYWNAAKIDGKSSIWKYNKKTNLTRLRAVSIY